MSEPAAVLEAERPNPVARWASTLSPVIVFVAVLAVWQLFAVTVEPGWLPPLTDVWGQMWGHVTDGSVDGFDRSGWVATVGLGLAGTLLALNQKPATVLRDL